VPASSNNHESVSRSTLSHQARTSDASSREGPPRSAASSAAAIAADRIGIRASDRPHGSCRKGVERRAEPVERAKLDIRLRLGLLAEPVDPDRRQAELDGRRDVVEEARADVDVGTRLADLLAATPVVVLAARATVPGLRRLETCVDLVGAGRVVAAVLGPSRTRWPREVIHSLGPLTQAVIAAGRLVEIPEDRVLAVAGLTWAPLPSSLITAAATLLPLTKGTPSDAA